MTVRIGVVGAGRMGKLHSRVLSEMLEVELACVVDTNIDAAGEVGKQYDAPALNDLAQAVELVDAVIVAVPLTGV